MSNLEEILDEKDEEYNKSPWLRLSKVLVAAAAGFAGSWLAEKAFDKIVDRDNEDN